MTLTVSRLRPVVVVMGRGQWRRGLSTSLALASDKMGKPDPK